MMIPTAQSTFTTSKPDISRHEVDRELFDAANTVAKLSAELRAAENEHAGAVEIAERARNAVNATRLRIEQVSNALAQERIRLARAVDIDRAMTADETAKAQREAIARAWTPPAPPDPDGPFAQALRAASPAADSPASQAYAAAMPDAKKQWLAEEDSKRRAEVDANHARIAETAQQIQRHREQAIQDAAKPATTEEH